MFDFEKSVEIMFTPEFEGYKYSNIPGDYGGGTLGGLTQHNYDLFRAHRKQDLRSVELADKQEIIDWYQIYAWDDAGCDQTFELGKDKLAFVLFNCSVQRGYVHAVETLQYVLGMPTQFLTGHYGSITRDEVSKCDETKMVEAFQRAFFKHFVDHVADDPTQAKFMSGWTHRLNTVNKLVGLNIEFGVS